MVTLEKYKAEMERMREGLAEKFESVLKRHIHGSVMTLEPMEMAFECVLARSNVCRRKQHSSEQSCCPQPVSQMHQQHHIQVFICGMGAFIEYQKNFNCLLGLPELCGSYGAQDSHH
ncbi:LOW QUALITY PROTEIN: hypothetical protein PHMEG_00026373 [Phytophthora megakarya]|uniref:Uncharacterized protein n=1 Tax=Phytophthora megakarya TaxID=4795 RepID=A0A225VBF6_9STRA|nr:LOW QUALITY PROTEIN: hypothetical protein PHMEG_00026373 [Phytophthora megakarya]